MASVGTGSRHGVVHSEERLPATTAGSSDSPRWVLAWASLGGFFALLAIYIFSAWIITGEAVRTPTGADPVPAITKFWVRFFEGVSVMAAIATIVYVVRQSRREGRLSFDAMLVIGWFAVWWQDPIDNYLRPQFYYNSYAVNLGSWTERIPGWVSPNGSKLPEHILFTGAAYIWMMALSVLFCWGIRKAKGRWPGLGNIRLFLVGFTTMAIFDVVFEIAMIRTKVFAYPGAVHGLSYAGGKWHQFPLYEPILASAIWGASGALRYWRDDKGRSWAERGIDRVKVSPKRQTALRTLAIVGYMNVALLVTYMLPLNWIGLHIDKVPEYPSYLQNGICGPGTGYDCPDPTKPMPLPLVPPASDASMSGN